MYKIELSQWPASQFFMKFERVVNVDSGDSHCRNGY